MHVDRLTEDDWETLRDLRLRALALDGEAFGASLERERGLKESHWRMRLRASPWFISFVQETAVGLVCVIDEPGAPSDERHLVSTWVSPEHRGTGVGDAPLAAAETWSRHDGARLLTLWLRDTSPPAAVLFRRAGYVPTGIRVPDPRDGSLAEERWTKVLDGDRAPQGLPEPSRAATPWP